MKRDTSYQRFTRASLDGTAIFANIQELLTWLTLGYRPVYPPPSSGQTSAAVATSPKPLPIEWEQLTGDQIKSVTVVINTQLKLLAKVLPDLKSVESNDVSDTGPRLSDIEAAQRVLSMTSAATTKVLN